MSLKNGSFTDACLGSLSEGNNVQSLPSAIRFEGFHPVTTSVERVASMSNSRLHNFFHIDVRNLVRCIIWGPLCVGLAISVTQAKAEYRVNIGDVLEIAVAGVPELRYRAPVQLDGNMSLPLVGMLPVAGLTLPQIRVQVGAAFANKPFRQRTPEGRENVIVIDPDEVTTIVADYRPIYVDGDVSKPGEYPYRPAITVRQLIAVAGGYDIMHMRMNNPYLESADLRGEYASLWTEFAKEQARMWRIKNELGDGSPISPAVLRDAPVARPVISEIINAETEYLKTKQSDYQHEKAFLQRGVEEGDDEFGVLSKQEKQEEQGYQQDVEELNKVTDLYSKGAVVSTRFTDARRAVLLSSTRKLQVTAQILQVKKQQNEFATQLERLDDQRRLNLLSELVDTSVKLNETREKLQSAGEKLEYTAMVRSQLARGGDNNAEFAIIRKGEKGQQRIIASEDTELQPGDAVEVTLRYQDGPDSPLRRPGGSNSPAGNSG